MWFSLFVFSPLKGPRAVLLVLQNSTKTRRIKCSILLVHTRKLHSHNHIRQCRKREAPLVNVLLLVVHLMLLTKFIEMLAGAFHQLALWHVHFVSSDGKQPYVQAPALRNSLGYQL